MNPDRLTPLDASFLHLEDEVTHMHVAAVLAFDGDPPAYERFVEHVERRLDLVPRYRQRLGMVPLGQGRPRWVDDEDFDIRYHVRDTSLPAPGSEDQLRVLAGRVFGQQLARHRPLWELWLVEGLEGGRFAVLSKTHHALVDGVSGLDILSVLFAPEPADAEPGAWRPAPAPGGAGLLAEAVVERLTVPAELVRPARALLRRPLRLLRGAAETAGGLGAFALAGLRPAPASPYNTRIGRDRRLAWVRAELDDFKAVKNALGGTVNDVVLTVVTRAIRAHLARRGEDIETMELKALVPVSIRPEGERGALGNQVAAMVATLPVGCSEPEVCLRQISEQMRGLKQSGQAVGAEALTGLMGFAPPTIMDQAARAVARRQRAINLVVTNVPGPQFALRMDGHELLDILPLVPLGQNTALNVAIVSYNGHMSFGLVGDFDAIPDLDDLAAALDALAELADAAGVELAAARDDRSAEAPGPEPAAPAEPAAVPEPAVEPPPAAPAAPGAAVGSSGAGPRPGAPESAADARAEPVAGPPEEDELVAESADQGAEDGAGAELRVEAPWDGYERMTAAEVEARLPDATAEQLAVIDLYERTHRKRRTVLRAAERELAHR